MTDQPFVSVVVPHFNDLKGLNACLDALSHQTYPRQKTEIIVADNASPMGEQAVAAIIAGRARLVVVSERGAGPARNGGVAVATGEVLAFTDSDCRPHADWLAQGVAALSRWDFVGGKVAVAVDDPAAMTPAEAFECVFAFDNRAYVETKGFTVTANLFCARKLFQAVGGFRTGVPEDLEWSLRAGQAGYRIGYADKAVVDHPARRTWAELTGKWRRLNAEAFGLEAATPAGRRKWRLKALAMPLSALAHTPRVLQQPGMGPGAKAAAIGMLFRLRWWRMVDSLQLLSVS